MSLREQLIGTWKLVSYVEHPEDGSAPSYPMSETPMGIIIYTADGFVSAQIMNPNRKHFVENDWFSGTDEEYRQEASTYISYSGPFQVDEEKQALKHSMYVSLFPNWTGQTQARAVKFENGLLQLSSLIPLMSRGHLVKHVLTWRRAQ